MKGNKKGDKRETTGGKLATARRKHFRKHGWEIAPANQFHKTNEQKGRDCPTPSRNHKTRHQTWETNETVWKQIQNLHRTFTWAETLSQRSWGKTRKRGKTFRLREQMEKNCPKSQTPPTQRWTPLQESERIDDHELTILSGLGK